MNQRKKQMQLVVKEKQNSLVQKDQWLNELQIEIIINRLTTSQIYRDIEFFEIKKNLISFIVFNEQFQKQNLVVFEKGCKQIDNTKIPCCYYQEEFTIDISIKEFDKDQHQKAQKIYSLQDLKMIQDYQDFQFVKAIKQEKELDNLINDNLSLCTSLIKFTLIIRDIQSIKEEDKSNFLLHIGECLKNCYHLQYMDIQLQTRIDKYQVEQFIHTTTQFENITKYILTLRSLYLDLNNLQNIGTSFKNFKKLNNFQTRIWSDDLNHEGVSRLYSQISNIKSIKKLTIDLQQNKIQSQGAINLSKCLENLQGLTKLKIDLWNNQIEQDGIVYLVNQICKISSLKHLKFLIWKNSIKYEQIAQALENLSCSSSIYRLDLVIEQKQLQPSNISQIVRTLRNFSKIYWFQIDLFSYQLNDEIKLFQAIKKNKRLVYFKQVDGLKY
ncbi:kinase domain protein, putative (macronuclear) [Tetrahymena thermophila SB210]|uniref:Kinase domain protein, putative n=1 Tax=Tetrahymena thermophila (strain SB210) TaxID=312017 RepID=Q23Q00_TETTS|nr:kinase domain protein, putative [Tetrahymena thermophila SB210]EAR98535.2 kinase domain protein, putative [Tetrahymena thermophila SB210]|eukprot:XP_001018780.2 kinase domain protein, putative [Tetrahymena thermophila SB210]